MIPTLAKVVPAGLRGPTADVAGALPPILIPFQARLFQACRPASTPDSLSVETVGGLLRASPEDLLAGGDGHRPDGPRPAPEPARDPNLTPAEMPPGPDAATVSAAMAVLSMGGVPLPAAADAASVSRPSGEGAGARGDGSGGDGGPGPAGGQPAATGGRGGESLPAGAVVDPGTRSRTVTGVDAGLDTVAKAGPDATAAGEPAAGSGDGGGSVAGVADGGGNENGNGDPLGGGSGQGGRLANGAAAVAAAVGAGGEEDAAPAGTSPADLVSSMHGIEPTTESAGMAEQNLPGRHEGHGGAGGESWRQADDGPGGGDPAAVVAASASRAVSGAGRFSDSVEVATAMVPVAGVEMTERIAELMHSAVTRMRRNGTGDFEVEVRPDRDTELVLRMTTRDGVTEVQAELRRGDAAAFAGRWQDLQERLAEQGVRLAAWRTAGDAAGVLDRGAGDSHARWQWRAGEDGPPDSTPFRRGAAGVERLEPRVRPLRWSGMGWETWA